MPPRKRRIKDSLQVTATRDGQSSTTNKSPNAERQKRQMMDPIRYRYKNELSKSPTPPPADKDADEGVHPREVIVNLMIEEVRPRNAGLNEDEAYTNWHSTFHYQGKALRESNSLCNSPLVASTIMYGITKAADMAEHAQISTL